MNTTSTQTSAARASFDLKSFVRRRARDLAPFVTLVVLFVFFSVTTPSFLNFVNLRNVLAQVSTLAVVSTAQKAATVEPKSGTHARSGGGCRYWWGSA